MDVGLYRAAGSMVDHQRRLETIADNMANLATAGFKRTAAATHELAEGAGTFRGAGGPRQQARVSAVATRVDFSQGELERTGRDLDLALFGSGFFAVDGPAGELYTRDGSFHLTPEGVLVTSEGWPVAFEERGAGVDPTGLPVAVDGEGAVRQGALEVGRLRIVDFTDPQGLERDEHGFWRAPVGLEPTAHTAVVHQYALEASNAAGVSEIVEMIGVQRGFESLAQVVSSIEESYRRLTRPF